MVLIKKNCFSIIVLLLISCGGVKFVKETSGSENVNLVTTVDQKQCEFKGETKESIKGYSDKSYNNTEKNLVQLGKNAAVEINANTIIILERKQYRDIQKAIFKMYYCK